MAIRGLANLSSMLGAGALNCQHLNHFAKSIHIIITLGDGAACTSRLRNIFAKSLLPDFPGADETEKLNLVFASAPLWFLWFTHADVIGRVLGLKLVDLSSNPDTRAHLFPLCSYRIGRSNGADCLTAPRMNSAPGRGSTSARGWLFRTTSPRVSACVRSGSNKWTNERRQQFL